MRSLPRARTGGASVPTGGEILRAGAVQLNSTDDVERNLETADRLVRDAAGRGAQLVILPEKWNMLASGERMADAAEPLDGPSLSWPGEVGPGPAIALVAGRIAEGA